MIRRKQTRFKDFLLSFQHFIKIFVCHFPVLSIVLIFKKNKSISHMILGIDVGGTTVKFGLVSPDGNITNIKAYDTPQWVAAGFTESLKAAVAQHLKAAPEIKGVGIGFPGLLSADRKSVLVLPNVPGVEDVPVVDILKEEFPDLPIRIDNDAKCATMGELHFGEDKNLDNFILITLGTGVGSGAVINRKLFLGARGNGMEIGHMPLEGGKTFEQHLGIQHLVNYATERINKENPDSPLKGLGKVTPKDMYEAAENGDAFAKSIFEYAGEKIGLNLVSVIRVLDITTILLGGGIAGAFDHLAPATLKVLQEKLPEYYTKDLVLKKAYLNNQVGILGAAGLVMDDVNKKVIK